VDHGAELLGDSQPLGVGIDVVDLCSQRCREGGPTVRQPSGMLSDNEAMAVAFAGSTVSGTGINIASA
jgi:hypothetical protein